MNHDDRDVFPSPDYKEEQLVEGADGRQLTADGHRRGADRADQPRAADRLRLTAIGAETLCWQSCTEPSAVSRKPIANDHGQVYEQFLGLSACGHAQSGEVIRLTAGHQAKVEEKPEVRKAGGLPALEAANRERIPRP